jgi:hypothetical protein
MTQRLIIQAAIALAACAAPLHPARAEFFSYAQMRGLCRGETGEAAEFRTDASHRLLAETYRARCRMYLLGQADAYLDQANRPDCIRPGTADAEVAEALVQGLLRRTETPAGGVGEVVRDVLRARYGCTPA